jgi:hypothetical protein
MGCIASPAIVTFLLLSFPKMTIHGGLNINGAHDNEKISACRNTSRYSEGKFDYLYYSSYQSNHLLLIIIIRSDSKHNKNTKFL